MQQISPVILFIGGILGGLYAANVGGGALLGFPLLVLLGLPTLSAIATQRFAAVILEAAGSIKFYKEGKTQLKLGIIFGILAAIGAFFGANIVVRIEERILNLIIGIIFLLIALFIYKKDNLGIKEKKVEHKNLILAALATLIVGVYGGFFGAGFGTFSMLIFVLLGFTFIKSAATARVVGLFMSTTSALVFANHGIINYVYGLSLGAGFAVGGWIGIGLAIKKGDTYIKSLLFIIIILSALKLLSGFINLKIVGF